MIFLPTNIIAIKFKLYIGKLYTPLSIILLNRRNVDIFPYCKKSANIYLHKSNIPNLKLGILDLCSENIPNLEIRNIGFM